MTFRDRINAFPEPYRSKLLANIAPETLDAPAAEITEYSDAGIVASQFYWELSPEGYDYWREFYRELSKGEKPL